MKAPGIKATGITANDMTAKDGIASVITDLRRTKAGLDLTVRLRAARYGTDCLMVGGRGHGGGMGGSANDGERAVSRQ